MSPEFSTEVSRKPPFSVFMSTHAMWARGSMGKQGGGRSQSLSVMAVDLLLNSVFAARCSRVQYGTSATQGKTPLLRKLAILGRRWTHIPKNQLPTPQVFAWRLYRGKRKQPHVEERVAGPVISVWSFF